MQNILNGALVHVSSTILETALITALITALHSLLHNILYSDTLICLWTTTTNIEETFFQVFLEKSSIQFFSALLANWYVLPVSYWIIFYTKTWQRSIQFFKSQPFGRIMHTVICLWSNSTNSAQEIFQDSFISEFLENLEEMFPSY